MIVNCLPAAIFLFLALCICLKSKAVSEFLRQDQKVFGTGREMLKYTSLHPGLKLLGVYKFLVA